MSWRNIRKAIYKHIKICDLCGAKQPRESHVFLVNDINIERINMEELCNDCFEDVEVRKSEEQEKKIHYYKNFCVICGAPDAKYNPKLGDYFCLKCYDHLVFLSLEPVACWDDDPVGKYLSPLKKK